MEAALGWFDLNGSDVDLGPAASTQLGVAQQALLYLVVVLGVVLSEAVAMARKGGPIRIELNRAWLVVACLVALVVFPAVWREIGSMAETSLLVQMGVAAQGGVFWGVIMAGAEKGVAG
jgi:polyferredoxin